MVGKKFQEISNFEIYPIFLFEWFPPPLYFEHEKTIPVIKIVTTFGYNKVVSKGLKQNSCLSSRIYLFFIASLTKEINWIIYKSIEIEEALEIAEERP